MQEMSADMVVSPCAPWSVTEFAQGTAFIGKQTLVPTQAFPVQGAMQFSKTVQRCVCVCVCVCMRVRAHVCQQLSHVQLCATPWTIVHQDLLSMEFSRQEYWSGLPHHSPGDLPNPGIKPGSPTLQVDSLPSVPPGKPRYFMGKVRLIAAPPSQQWL